MHMAYEAAYGSSILNYLRICAERNTQRHIPCNALFAKLHQRKRDSDQVQI